MTIIGTALLVDVYATFIQISEASQKLELLHGVCSRNVGYIQHAGKCVPLGENVLLCEGVVVRFIAWALVPAGDVDELNLSFALRFKQAGTTDGQL